MDNAISFVICGFLLFVFLIGLYFHPVTVLVTVGTCMVGSKILEIIWRPFRTDFEKRMARRDGENICTFRRSFNLREFDPWIVRAVYEEMQAAMDCGDGVKYPIRAHDRLEKDLLIEIEDWKQIVSDVAERAGYELANYEKNPLYGKLQTVGDLVMFFTHQRKLRPQ